MVIVSPIDWWSVASNVAMGAGVTLLLWGALYIGFRLSRKFVQRAAFAVDGRRMDAGQITLRELYWYSLGDAPEDYTDEEAARLEAVIARMGGEEKVQAAYYRRYGYDAE